MSYTVEDSISDDAYELVRGALKGLRADEMQAARETRTAFLERIWQQSSWATFDAHAIWLRAAEEATEFADA